MPTMERHLSIRTLRAKLICLQMAPLIRVAFIIATNFIWNIVLSLREKSTVECIQSERQNRHYMLKQVSLQCDLILINFSRIAPKVFRIKS